MPSACIQSVTSQVQQTNCCLGARCCVLKSYFRPLQLHILLAADYLMRNEGGGGGNRRIFD